MIAKRKELIQASLEEIWNHVTTMEDSSWRSDLKEIKKISETEFDEIAHNGRVTHFIIVKKEPYTDYEMKFENDLMKGTWKGNFSIVSETEVEICFEEVVSFKKKWMKPIVSLFHMLDKMQQQYITDLKKNLSKNKEKSLIL